MKKILIISRLFSPVNRIGAIRPTKFAKYLKMSGKYIIHVVASTSMNCSKLDSFLNYDEKEIDIITQISNSSFIIRLQDYIYRIYQNGYRTNRISVSIPESKCSIINNIKNWVKYLLMLLNEYDYLKQFKKLKLDFSEYDFLYSTYSTHANHLIASYIKRKNKKIRWVADFRDPVYQDSTVPFGFKSYAKKFTMKYCQNADCIMAVSEGCMYNLFIGAYKNKRFILPNGFDPEDKKCLTKESDISNKFSFAYTGMLYGQRRDLSPLFKVLNELICNGLIDKEKIVFKYAGNEFSSLYNMAEKYGLTEILKDYGQIERKDSLNLQYSSQILVICSWNKKNETGVVPGKLLEYMMIEKPILGIISGNLSGSKVKEIIKKTNTGFAYESANDETDYKLLKTYILNQYNLFIKNGSVIYEPIKAEIEKYNYKYLTAQLMSLFEDL